MRIALVFALLGGCSIGPFETDGPRFDVVSDSGQLRIDACADTALLGCQGQPYVAITATLDGANVAVPAVDPSGLFDLFPQYDHELRVPSPADPHFTIALPNATLAVEELPWFEVAIPDAPPRSPLVVTFEHYKDVVVTAGLTTFCDDGIAAYLALTPADQTLTLTFPASTSTCAHTLDIAQERALDHDKVIASATRAQHYMFTTVP